MTDGYNPDGKLEQLLLDLLDGEWDTGKQQTLDTLLINDAAARAHYRELMAMHAMLDSELSGAPDLNGEMLSSGTPGGASSPSRVGDAQSAPDCHEPAVSPVNPRFVFLRWAAAALLIMSVGVGLLSLVNAHRGNQQPLAGSVSGEDPRPNKEDAPGDGVVAVVTRTIHPRWADGAEAVRPGQSLARRWVKLDAGVVQFEFRNGACVTLQGPAQFRLDSTSECFIRSGKLTVLVPPAAANFTVHSPFSKVIDLGTEFGLVVDESGELDVHVLDGQVEVALEGDEDGAVVREKLSEQQAATVRAGQRQLEDIPFDQGAFEPIRATTLWRTQPLKIQFDCGSRAGVYCGSQSPAHAAGDMYPHETRWNAVVGDQAGGFVLADGSILSHRIEVDLGHGKNEIDWDAGVDTMRGPQGRTRGVFDTALGRDVINPPPGSTSGLVGLRLRGLPAGKYRVYVLGRTSLDHANWGNYLVEKAHVAAVGLDVASIDAPGLKMSPLGDANAGKWVAGQTHVVTDVAVSGPDQFLTIITGNDRENSPIPAGGRAVILGVQILQLTDGSDGSDV